MTVITIGVHTYETRAWQYIILYIIIIIII